MKFEERPEVQQAYQSQFEADHLLKLEEEFNASMDDLVACGTYTQDEAEVYKLVHHKALWGSHEAE